jgi:hypothetical protein
VLVLELLLVNEWVGEKKPQVCLPILLVKHRSDLTHISLINFDDMEVFRVEILHNNFRPIVLSDIDGNELLKAIEL